VAFVEGGVRAGVTAPDPLDDLAVTKQNLCVIAVGVGHQRPFSSIPPQARRNAGPGVGKHVLEKISRIRVMVATDLRI
jgi:hypothetical protein